MSSLLERAVAPIIVTMIWVMAILILFRDEASGVAPMTAGLVGGVALVLQAYIGGEREIRRVFGLRAPIAAALAFMAFLAGAALALGADPRQAATLIGELGGIRVTLGLLSAMLVRFGIALALAAILAEAALRLMDEARE